MLPSLEYEQDLVRKTVDAGAVDGMSAKQEYRVDGFTLEENSQTVQRLHGGHRRTQAEDSVDNRVHHRRRDRLDPF